MTAHNNQGKINIFRVLNEMIQNDKKLITIMMLPIFLFSHNFIFDNLEKEIFELSLSYEEDEQIIFSENDRYLNILNLIDSEDFIENVLTNQFPKEDIDAETLRRSIDIYRIYNQPTLVQLLTMYPRKIFDFNAFELFNSSKGICIITVELRTISGAESLALFLLDLLNLNAKTIYPELANDFFQIISATSYDRFTRKKELNALVSLIMSISLSTLSIFLIRIFRKQYYVKNDS
jgi:hypothetical protein